MDGHESGPSKQLSANATITEDNYGTVRTRAQTDGLERTQGVFNGTVGDSDAHRSVGLLPHDPKPAYWAAVTAQKLIGGRPLPKRLNPVVSASPPVATVEERGEQRQRGREGVRTITGIPLMDSVFALEFPQRHTNNATGILHSNGTERHSATMDRVLVAWAVGYDNAPVNSDLAGKMSKSQKMCAVPLRNQTDCGPRGLSAKSCAALGCCAQDIEPKCFAPFQNKSVQIELHVDAASGKNSSSGGSGCFQRYDMFGVSQGQVCARNGKISLVVSGEPVYLNAYE